VLAGAGFANANTYQWNGSTSTNWSTAAKWSSGGSLTAGPALTGGCFGHRLNVTNLPAGF